MFKQYLSKSPLLLALLSGLLLSASFTSYLFWLSFISLVPLFLLVKQLFDQKISTLKFIQLNGLAFLLWNALTTWWISLASVGGSIMAIVANSILMCMFFSMPFLLQKKYSKNVSLWWIIPFWISFEYLHYHWDLMWPWLCLGNVFAFAPWMVQWYELTGTSGGTLWILASNIIITQYLINGFATQWLIKNLINILVIPIVLSLSLLIYRSKALPNNFSDSLNVLIVQPNVDPYNDKFYIEPLIQVNAMYQQIKPFLNDSIDVIVLPETFITENIYEGSMFEMLQYPSIRYLYDSILMKYPTINIITGANTFKVYSEKDKIPATARQNSEGMFYDIFNTALCLSKDTIQIFHKSKLVPGVEKMPYPEIFKPLENLAIDLGGTTGSLGQQDQPSLLFVKNKIPVATIICYESVFSDFVSKFFKIGAKALFIITNDGWWGDTPGYYQHLMFGRLRSIENRTYIARSANTGISAVIDPLGNILQQTNYWTREHLIAKIPLQKNASIYSHIGDIISPVNVLFLVLFLFKILFPIMRK